MNYHLIEPVEKYRAESNRLIEEYRCWTRKDSVRVIEALITATPEFFKGKKKSEVRAYFQTALEFIEKYQDSKTIHFRLWCIWTRKLHICTFPLSR